MDGLVFLDVSSVTFSLSFVVSSCVTNSEVFPVRGSFFLFEMLFSAAPLVLLRFMGLAKALRSLAKVRKRVTFKGEAEKREKVKRDKRKID